MDGFDRRDQIIVLAATNRPDVLDKALVRPGRFDRKVGLPLPDFDARVAILRVHCRDKPHVLDLDAVARKTIGFSGAALKTLVNEAAIRAARRGDDAVRPRDVDDALDRLSNVKKIPPTLLDAYHQAGHALVASLLPRARRLDRVSINGPVFVGSDDDDADSFRTKADLHADICVALAGRAAETLVFGSDETTTRGADDLQRVRHVARAMVAALGLSPATLGPGAWQAPDVDDPLAVWHLGKRANSEPIERLIDREVADLAAKAHATVFDLLADHRDALDDLAHTLLDVETLDAADLQALLEGHPTTTLARATTSPPPKKKTKATTTNQTTAKQRSPHRRFHLRLRRSTGGPTAGKRPPRTLRTP